jgi:hypothetical protein
MTGETSFETVFDPVAYRDDVDIDQSNLSNAFTRQAALFAYYAGIHANAVRVESRMKLLADIEESRIDKDIRDRAADSGGKVTEKQIEQEIARTPTYITAVHAYNEAKANTALAWSATEAFRQRRDMLIQLGANQREEMKGEARMTHGSPAADRLVETLRRHDA